MAAEQQAIVNLKHELADTRSRVQQLIDGHEALKAAHDALNLPAQQALADKDHKIQETENRLRNLLFRQQIDLLDSKELKADHFRGRARL